MVYFGNFGFIKPSQSHQYLSFISRVVSLGLDEFVTLGETLTTSQFFSRELADTIVVSELLENVVSRVRNLAETIKIEQGGFIGDDFVEDDFDIDWEVTRIVTKYKSITESLSISDAVAIITPRFRSLFETITISNSYTYDGLTATYDITSDNTLSPNSKFRCIFRGVNPQDALDVGQVGVRAPAGGRFTNVFYEYPYTVTNTGGSTSASLTLNEGTTYGDFDITFSMRTIEQMKSSPAAWETAWFMWHYTDAYHHYYLTIKTNGGIELGKKDNLTAIDEQYFLSTSASVTWGLGTFYEIRIRVVGSTITVWVDGVQKINLTDDGSLGAQPWAPNTPAAPTATLLNGKFGLYNEDAEVEFSALHLGTPELSRVLTKVRSLTQTITIGETLTRTLIKLRPIIAQEAVTISETLTLARVRGKALADSIGISDALSRITIKSRALAESIGIGDVLTRALIKLRSPNLPEVISISDAVTALKVKGKALADTITIGETPAMIRSKFRTLAESISITDLLQRGKSIPKDLVDTITIADSVIKSRIRVKSISETTIAITDQVTKLKPVVRSITETAITITDSVIRLVTTFVRTWILSSHSSDFPSRLDGLVIDYITANWTETDPLIGGTAPTLQRENVNIGNYDYDKFRTYYIKVTEGQAEIHNRVRGNLYGFETPIEFECWARRLSKGEAFDQLNNIINELLRILLEYQAEDIFGVQGVLFDSITPLETTGNKSLDSAAKTLWKKTLRVRLVYYKVNLLRGTTP